MKNGLLNLGVVFLTLIFLPFASAKNPSGLPDSLVKKVAERIFVSLRSLDRIEKGIQTEDIVPRSLIFDHRTGWYLTFTGAEVSAEISILDERDFSIRLKENSLPRFWPLDADNRIVPLERIIKENTRIEIGAARKTAEAVAKTLFGDHVLDGLRRVRGESAATGNYIGYIFRWKTEDSNSIGGNSITIWIHPKTGRLSSVSRFRSNPPVPEVSGERAKHLVSDFLIDNQYPGKVVGLHLSTKYERGGRAYSVWSVRAEGEKRNKLGFYGELRFYVDATSGAVSLAPGYGAPGDKVDAKYEQPIRFELSAEEASSLMPVPRK